MSADDAGPEAARSPRVGAGPSLHRLSEILWRERAALERLAYRLEVQYLLASAGRQAWMGRSAADVEQALDLVVHLEVLRTIELADTVAALGLGDDVTMALVTAAARPPQQREFLDHHEALVRLTCSAVSLAEPTGVLLWAVRSDTSTASNSHGLPPSLLQFVLG